MRGRTRTIAALLLLVSASACGVAVRATPFAPGAHPPRPPDAPVQMFSTRVPECDYEELGLLRAESKNGLTPWQRVVETFLHRARQMGGDAVILRHGVELRPSPEGGTVDDEFLSGTVIRFPPEGCRR